MTSPSSTAKQAAPGDRGATAAAPTGDGSNAEARRRLEELRAFADGVRTLPILTQAEPDPDAIGSALAVRMLLERDDRSSPIISLGRARRPETRRMMELLDVSVTEVTEDELRAFAKVVAVDLEPVVLRESQTRVAVIDHHPPQSDYRADFHDVRPEYGAASTMLAEYLRAAGREVGQRLATALLYGIRTDTALLTRGCTRADVEAYAYLQERADLALLSKIDRPAYPRDALAQLGHAIANTEIRDELALLWLGRVRKNRSHLMPELADLSLNIEGVRWAVAAGVIERALVLNLRYLADSEPGAGALARRLADGAGSGGGHATMARVEIPLDALPFELRDEPEEGDDDSDDDSASARHAAHENAARLADWIDDQLDRLRDAAREERRQQV